MAILVIAFILVAGLAVVIAMQPDEFRYVRSTIIAASPSTVFDHVNNLQKWATWSPWAKMDPNAKVTFEGPLEGTGAVNNWDGNNQVGAGRMTILESVPYNFIKFQLDFQRPMKATNMAEFTFTPDNIGTRVTWTMYGKSNFMGKAVGLVMNCEKMVGGQFEEGLSQLKAVAEATK